MNIYLCFQLNNKQREREREFDNNVGECIGGGF